ncbi:DUF3526 domain-containing protein [Hyalangium rubrum]|uniref:DUF3526 domain-containing protein n=1 Tax=Hyalangium rubrum TaxID=3103134 RepID=A0ABU5GWK8_9BACT|nr:DUF3526 domain-containing protein [Hyalangium sp. s54d21]MDY7225421.1 DUF3526 domain-containing protein [Hyalangium sp. s54d21]
MIFTIARKEWVDLTRDGRFRAAAVFISLLAAMGLVAGARHLQTTRAEREEGRRLTRQQWLEQGEKNPHSAAHYGVWAFKPESPLAAFDRGLEPYLGVAVYLEAHKQNLARYRPAMDSTTTARFGELTGAGVLQLLIPLLVILLTFSAFTAEREGGTLRLLLSTGVRRHQLVLGKALGVGLALLILLVPLLVLAVGVLLALGASASDTLTRIAVLVLGYALYLGSFIFLGLAVSATVRSSRLSLVVLLGCWALNGLLVPRLASDMASTWAPAPSVEGFSRRIAEDYEKGMNGHDPADARRVALENEVLARYGVTSKQELPINFDGLALQAGEEYSNRVHALHFGELWGTYRRQEGLHRAFALAAPLLALRALSSALAGTDLEAHLHFTREAEAYRQLLVRQMNDAVTHRSRTGDWTYKANKALWQEVSDFQPVLRPWSHALQDQGISLALLAGWLLLTAVLALRTGARMSAV